MSDKIEAPEWEIGWGSSVAQIYKEHRVHVENLKKICTQVEGSHFEGYEEWGIPSEFRKPAGSRYGGSLDE